VENFSTVYAIIVCPSLQCGCSILVVKWLDSSAEDIALVVAHAAGESILCHEGWQCGSSQMSLERTGESSCLDIGRIIGNLHLCVVPMRTLEVL